MSAPRSVFAFLLVLACATALATNKAPMAPKTETDSAPYQVKPAPAAFDSVAVLDFAIPSAETNRWAWAQGAIADLLQIELERLGMVTVDRDLIHAVLAEQRLTATGLTEKDQLKVGSLLHARHLITGKVLPLEAKRVRLEVTAFSVEAVEMVFDGTGEGEFPNELAPVLQKLVKQVAAKLQASGSPPPSAQSASAPKPEALIMFYRGLNACARGQPESAVPWFMNAAILDTDFIAPRLWEIKAYELAGFEQYAALQREETEAALKELGLEVTNLAGGDHSAKPVLAVLNPVLATQPITLGETTPVSLAATLKEALLSTGQVRLFAFENLGEAVAEQDLKLSSLFAKQYAPRYGRWLASDALVVWQVSFPAPDQVVLDLALVNPITAVTINRVERKGAATSLSSQVREAAKELVGNWRNSWAPQARVLPAAGLLTAESGDGGVELRPAFRGLASALVQARLAPTKSDSHRALANAFGATGRPQLAAREIERCIATLDIYAPKADGVFLGTHRWLFWEPSPVAGCGALGFVDRRYITNLIQPLLTTYPESLAAGCLHYNLAIDDWHGTNWLGAVEHARRAHQIIEARPEKGGGDPDIIAAAYFLEGSSLRHLARPEEAKAVLHRGQEFMEQSKAEGFCLPLGPYIGDSCVAGFGGDRPDLRTRIREELVLIEGKPYRAPGLDLRLDAEDIVSATNAPTRTQAEWLLCAEQVLSILERVPVGQADVVQGVLGSANACLSSARSKGADAARLRPLAQRFAATLLAKRAIPSFDNIGSAALPEVTEAAVEVMSLYESAGLKEEGWGVLELLFTDRCPAELTLNLLLHLQWDVERYPSKLKQAIARLPAGDTNIAGSTWLRLGQVYYQNERYAEALDCYQRAVAKNIPLGQCPGALSALVEVALERNPDHPVEEIERTRQQLGFPLVEASVVEWFSAGRKYQAGRQYDLEKAVVCYRQAIEFLEHPEQGGFYHVEKLPNCELLALRWGPSLGEWDLRWSETYDERWHSSAFYLAQCLIELGRKEEAAQWLRRIALKAGGDDMPLLSGMGWNGCGYTTVHLGARAAEMLKELHLDPGLPKFGEVDGPYKLPPIGLRARPVPAPPPPAPKPEVVKALTNALLGFPRNERSWVPQPQVQELVRQYGHDVVPAVLVLVPRAGELWDELTLAWLLNRTAVPSDAPWVIAACVKHWGLIGVAWKLDPPAAAEALAGEWQAQSRAGFVHFFFIFAVLDGRVRPLYPLAMDHIAEKKVNHHSVIFRMDEVVNEEKSDELESAFREALSQCLKLKLQQKEYYELPRISQIALRHGVPEAIRGLLACEVSAPAQLLRDVRPFVDLPAQENEAVELLRGNAGKWQWEPGRKKFTLPTPET